MSESRSNDRDTDADHEDLEEGQNVSDAPHEGKAVPDYFGFAEIFKRVLSTADHELDVSNTYLFWSALGAGGAIGLTFLSRVVFTEASGEAMPGLLGNLLYPVGFLIIVLGRYQLFTENTLTPVVLVLTRLASIRELLRLWVVVFFGNMVGAILFAAALAFSNALTPEQTAMALKVGHHAIETPWTEVFDRALFAGWIVAAMVWLVHAARDTIGRALVIFIPMYFIGVGGFFHVITSSVEVFYIAFADPAVGFWQLWPDFVAPVFLGNTVGGIIFVAVLNYAQFAEHEDSDMIERYGKRLDLKAWSFSGREKRVSGTGK